jgi:hypothetical protein
MIRACMSELKSHAWQRGFSVCRYLSGTQPAPLARASPIAGITNAGDGHE